MKNLTSIEINNVSGAFWEEIGQIAVEIISKNPLDAFQTKGVCQCMDIIEKVIKTDKALYSSSCFNYCCNQPNANSNLGGSWSLVGSSRKEQNQNGKCVDKEL